MTQKRVLIVLGPYLWTPATWSTGKWAAILTYIDQ